jgi:ankyrin repeat protein
VDGLRSVFSLWFDSSDSIWFEEQQFTPLHKIILGSIARDLEAELQLSTSDINKKDSKGRTPISWASARCDEHAVRTLLKFGADPNISCTTGNNPLLRSVRANSPACTRLLLEWGADVRSKSTLGFTALHYAAYYRDDEAYLRPLFDFNAPVEEKDQYGWTALSCTAEYDHVISAAALLDYGADIESRDKDGWTPLLRAVNSNSHRVLKLLLERGANYDVVSFRNETILHFAAARGDCETVDILAAADMKGLGTRTENDRGLTAIAMMLCRPVKSPDLVTSFTNLLKKLDGDANP